jgi:uncharacterized phiE125 gp8 family phage protein
MLLRRLTPAAQLPPALALAEAKAHLRLELDDDTEDALLTGVLIPAVAEAWEQYVKKPLVQAQYLALFPVLSRKLSVLADIVAVQSLEYLDASGEVVEVEASRYGVSLYDPQTLLLTYPSGSLPRAYGGEEAVRLYFTAGAASSAEVSPLRKQALLQLLSHWYENKQSVLTGTIATELPQSATWIMDLEREPTL